MKVVGYVVNSFWSLSAVQNNQSVKGACVLYTKSDKSTWAINRGGVESKIYNHVPQRDEVPRSDVATGAGAGCGCGSATAAAYVVA